LLDELLLKLLLNNLLHLLLNHLLLEARQRLLLLLKLVELKLHKHLLLRLAEALLHAGQRRELLHAGQRRELLHVRVAETAAGARKTAAGPGRAAAPLRVLHALCRCGQLRLQQGNRRAETSDSKHSATRHGHLDSAKDWRSGRRLRPGW